jgi:hypothetical protein
MVLKEKGQPRTHQNYVFQLRPTGEEDQELEKRLDQKELT